MNQEVQWLLIGGPQHGKTIWIKSGSRVAFFTGLDEVLHYEGENRLCDGKLYRLGRFSPSAEQVDQIDNLIKAVGLESLT